MERRRSRGGDWRLHLEEGGGKESRAVIDVSGQQVVRKHRSPC